jgi:hypothetical protein
MSTQFGNINPEDEIALNKSNAESWLVHGSLFYNGYIYGVPRVNPYMSFGHNALCKIKADDYSDYISVCMKNALGDDLFYGEQIVECGGYLYVSGIFTGLLRIDPDTLAHVQINTAQLDGMNTDGIYLYFQSGGRTISKYDPIMGIYAYCTIPDASYNDIDGGGTGVSAHSILIDDTYIWLNCLVSYGGLNYSSRIHKIQKSNMTYVGYAIVAQTTDDMGQDDNYVFCGHEPADVSCYGYTWGTSAVRKSDLAVFVLPKLSTSDTMGNISYASLRFGNYLFDCKINNHLYIIDITDPSTWTIESNPNNFVLYDYTITDPYNSYPHNEIVMDNDGKFHEFTWCPNIAAYLRRIIISGLNFISAPELNTVGANGITASFATLNGYIRASGGREIIACGFEWGTTSEIYDHNVSVPAVPAGSFSLLIENLTPGQTYYYRSYASNSIGTTYSNESSFTVLSNAIIPSILGSVTKDSAVVQGATIFLVNVGSGQFVAKKLSNGNGRFAFTNLLITSKYHAVIEYTDPNLGKWNTRSLPYLTPVLE